MPDAAATGIDFATLLARAGRGDESAIGELVRQYEPKVRIVARLLLGPALRPYLDSVDLTQSVHKSVVAGLRDERFAMAGPDDLIGVAVTILRRKAAKHWRHLQRQKRLSGVGTDGTDDLAGVLTSLSCTESDPADEAQFRDQVEHLCAHLNEAEKQILDLRLEGYTTAEIAAHIGITPAHLRVRLTRLRRGLEAAGVVADWL